MTIENILWSNLVPSHRNVRKVKTGINSLAASIAADGLLQNLNVCPTEDGKYEVLAGERRRRAIAKLVKSKIWPKDATVPCEVRGTDGATGISYAENAQRIAMHPADAIRAFGTMADEGYTEEAIAHRYGYDPREVRKLLTLARLSPKVLNALARDKIDVTTAQAFTLTEDHARQERALRHGHNAHMVRRMLTEEKIATTDRLFRFVGQDAYLAAGGTITGDLFSEEQEGFADHPELVQQLVDEKLNAEGEKAKEEGWGEVLVYLQTPSESYSWYRLYPDDGESYSAEAKEAGRLLVTIDYNGELDVTAYRQRMVRAANDAGTPLPRPLYASTTVEALSRIRTAALQKEVAKDTHTALAVLLDALLAQVLEGQFPKAHAVQLRRLNVAGAPNQDFNVLPMVDAFDGMETVIAALPSEPTERLAAIMLLDSETVHRLLACCTAALIDATQGKYAERERMLSVDRVARAVKLDMRQHWEGTAEFYGSLNRKPMLTALEEGRSKHAAENCLKLKKPELAIACAERLSGTGWLPPALLTPEVEITVADDAVEDDDTDMDMPEAA
jgi:ParB family chromosome partitioning protein